MYTYTVLGEAPFEITLQHIQRFLLLHQERHGARPTSAELHPKNTQMAEVLERKGVRVNFVGGCLAWELRLGHDLPSVNAPRATQEPAHGATIISFQNVDDSIYDAPYQRARGRPKKLGAEDRIEELAAQGVSKREIARRVGLSEATVRRRLRPGHRWA